MKPKSKNDPLFLYNLSNSGEAEIVIYDDIGPSWLGLIGADRIKEALDSFGDVSEVRVRINSYGGDVFEGTAIYNLLNTHQAKIIVVIDGVAASIASHIAMAGDEIQIAANARLMVHNARGIIFGQEKDFLHYAKLLESIDKNLAATYAERGTTSIDDWSALMDEETWLTAEDAQGHGVIDEIIARNAASARYDGKLHDYKHHPKVESWKTESVDFAELRNSFVEESGDGKDEPRPLVDAAKEFLKDFGD